MSELTLHTGAVRCTVDEVLGVPTPPPTDTWYPLDHGRFLSETRDQLKAVGFEVVRENHALAGNGNRYFGVLDLKNENSHEDYSWVVGLRNSHDRSFAAAVAGGTRVFVCDNLAFSGEVMLQRKHTKHAERDLRHLTTQLVGHLGGLFTATGKRIEAYKDRELTAPDAHHLLISAIDARAITPSSLPGVLDAWRHPQHEEFKPRTAWSLFNAFTEGNGGMPATPMMVKRNVALHGLFDGFCDLVHK
jgi:hypothetical protein